MSHITQLVNPLTTSGIAEADARLRRDFGEPRRRDHDPISQLVATIFSQATTDLQTARSFAVLRSRFPSWEQVRAAPVSEIANAIRSSGLAQQKAPRIKQVLRYITRERGRIELDFLKSMPVQESCHWLMRMTGVGPKTASIVLLFAFSKPVFPVDTHIHRVARRLGWIPSKVTAAKTHDLLEPMIPSKAHFRLHINLIQLGREICQARQPKCEVCMLKDLCTYYGRSIAKE